MTSYQVIYLPHTEKFFRKTPRNIAIRILNHVDKIALDPNAPNTNLKRLSDPLDGYRLRVGDYRIIYLLDHKNKSLIVTKVDHRSAIYL
jgi:mRNA interferase RelE/StbE